jgi:hypothetical protein
MSLFQCPGEMSETLTFGGVRDARLLAFPELLELIWGISVRTTEIEMGMLPAP